MEHYKIKVIIKVQTNCPDCGKPVSFHDGDLGRIEPDGDELQINAHCYQCDKSFVLYTNFGKWGTFKKV